MAIDVNDICRTFTFQNEEISVWTLDSMKDIGRVYTINTTIDLDSRIVEIPEDSTIVFVGEGKFTHGTLISNKTKFVNLPRCDSNSYGGTKNTIGDNPSPFADIVGKIYNIYTWFVTDQSDRTESYYKITANHYCEFDMLVKYQPIVNNNEIVDYSIDRVLSPSFYSFWDISQFSNLNLHTFSIRGHVFWALSQNNGQCGCGQFAGVSIKMPSYNFGCSCDDGLGVEFSNSSNLKELHITTSDAVGVPGESVVFNIGDSTSPNLPATIQYFNTVGTYRHPLYGVSGNLNALSGFSNLIELRISYTSIHGNITYLPSMSNLQKVNLTNCDIEGDIYKFSGCTELKEMIAQLKDITGNLSSLSGLTQLKKLDLSGTQVAGDISYLSNNTNLTELILPLQSITGNLSSLSSLTKLVIINLSGSQVAGDINYLTNLHKLATINLNSCNVEGDLSKLPVSCKEFRANGHTTPFTWSVTTRCARVYTYLDSGIMTQICSFAVSIPEQIEMSTSDDVQRMLTDISNSVAISNGSIVVRVNNLSDNDLQTLKSFCQGKLTALGQVGINTLVLNGETITNNN